MTDRWEIRESPPDPVVTARFGDLGPHFTVWDIVADRQVAFGGYGDRERARNRIARMDPVDYCTGCAWMVKAPGRSDCPTPEAHSGPTD